MSTAVQTSYGFGFPKGVAGGLFDLSAHDVTTRQAEGDGVAFGLGVVVGTNKGTDVKLPATGATSDDFEGVVVHKGWNLLSGACRRNREGRYRCRKVWAYVD